MSVEQWKVGDDPITQVHVDELRTILQIVDPTWEALPDKPAAFTPSAHSHDWGDVTGSPSTYPPSAHTHTISEVSQLQAELDKRTTRRVEVYTGTTSANGEFTVAFSPAFADTPFIAVEPPSAANQMWARISASGSGATFRLFQRNSVSLLSVEVLLASTVAVSGASCKMLVIGD